MLAKSTTVSRRGRRFGAFAPLASSLVSCLAATGCVVMAPMPLGPGGNAAVAQANTGQSVPVTPLRPPIGFIYTDVTAPLTTNYGQTSIGSREGTAKTLFVKIPWILGDRLSVAWDRADVEQAARNGGLNQVTFAEYRMLQVLGIFGQFTVIAHGD